MSLGLAIFLSALFLGIIALFIATKDRWNWKKLILWPLGISLGLLIFGSIGVYVYSLIPNKPKVQDTFWDISLNMSKTDVKFIKGAPTETQGEDVWIYKEQWTYSNEGKSVYTIRFKDEKIDFIFFTGSDLFHGPDLQGVWLHLSPATVRERFGEPSHIAVSDDDLERLYSYASYNVFFHMKKDRVDGYGIYKPEPGHDSIVFLQEKETQPEENATKPPGQTNPQQPDKTEKETQPNRNAMEPTQKEATKRPGGFLGWKVPLNWDKVRYGMSERQVISILGQPTSVEEPIRGGLRTLFYRGEVGSSGFVSGNVQLSDDRVYLVNKPVF